MEVDDLTSSEEDNQSSCGGTSERASQQHARTGRKGDPRMHRAVGARLADPKISLFAALRLGGFEYVNDDDANAMDSEQITLGQRKNQLSRRLRLVQKQQQQSADGNTGNSTQNRWPNKLTELFHGSGKKRSLPSSAFDETGLSDDPAMTYNKVQSLPDGNGVSPMRAKQHPDYHPLVVPLLHHRNFGTLGNAELPPHLTSAGNSASVRIQNAEAFAAPSYAMCNPSITFPMTFGVAPSPFAPQHPHHMNPSHVAINSLHQTAVSMGLTLEQLALALRSNNNLSQILSAGASKAPSKEQQQLALSLYQSEIRSLYQRAMLMAGYPPNMIEEEHSADAVQFMLAAWQMEGQRLNTLLKRAPLNGNLSMAMNAAFEQTNQDSKHGETRDEHDQEHHDSTLHHHDHDHSHSMDRKDSNTMNDETLVNGSNTMGTSNRHIHRLEGKCGHQPVLHQPAGGKPHIDFVIGDRVECYLGVPTSQDLHWPSNFSCEDVSCQDSCRGLQPPKLKAESNALSDRLPASSSSEWMALTGGDPIVYERSALDFESDEWNFDFTTSESLLGLVRLGDTTLDANSHQYKPST
jgi:hypothetical protein